MRTVAWRLAPAFLAIALSACFSYVPAEFDAVPLGESVRVYLTRQGIAAAGDALDQDGEPFLRGTLLRRDGDRMVLRVPVARRQVGFFAEPIGQDIEVRTSDVVQLERRRLDRTGTGLLVAGTVASAAAVIFLIIDSGGAEDIVDPPPPERRRIPIFSLPIR